ncbi:hypothetical protein M3Y98_01184500 [Aphelenchoides besseyi]|nr:hypothetical protein M3Y98_01184500 [Aphelenchoides besseyi]KAI6195236.1 hypothetical protein M3Y96_01209500 [Aphelenchoides besseyi]
MSYCSMAKTLLASTLIIMILSSALAMPYQHPVEHRHRKHTNRRLFTSSYTVADHAENHSGEGRKERANSVMNTHEITLIRQKSLQRHNRWNPNLLLRPDLSAQHFWDGDARFYRIGAAESKFRASSAFKNEGYGHNIKKILYRMN